MSCLRELRAQLVRCVWLAAYDLEESRERHAAQRRYVRSALCCIGLAALRMLGGWA